VNDILYRAAARMFYESSDRPGAHRKIEGLEHLDKVIDIDQSPIGRTPRSNAATYTNVFNSIRDLMAQVPDARMRGYGPGRFSFNVKGGRCENCAGGGQIAIEMHFLPDIYVTCDVCGGKRYNRETLEVRYKGLNVADILALTAEQAADVFANVPPIKLIAGTLNDVGLGYIHLGQPATTLSGGEAQRVKLARELARRATGRTLYILDEPTTGLHFDDVKKLLKVLHALVDRGNTVVVIEHNLDVVKTADYVIDLGPEGGARGGELVAEGTPEEVAKAPGSVTGRFLGPLLSRRPRPPIR
jgi:excinuclease ABC subunit A